MSDKLDKLEKLANAGLKSGSRVLVNCNDLRKLVAVARAASFWVTMVPAIRKDSPADTVAKALTELGHSSRAEK